MFRCHHVHDPRFDDQVRAEMLCYLAVSELVCMAERVTGSRPVTRSNWPASGCMPMARGVTGRNASRSRAWRPTSHPVGSRHSVSRRKRCWRRCSRMATTGGPWSARSMSGVRPGCVVHERRICGGSAPALACHAATLLLFRRRIKKDAQRPCGTLCLNTHLASCELHGLRGGNRDGLTRRRIPASALGAGAG